MVAIPLDIFALWIGIKGVKVLAYAMKTGHVTKDDKGDFYEEVANSLLIFLGALFYFPASVYLTLGLIWTIIQDFILTK
jgi:hypothetical protein